MTLFQRKLLDLSLLYKLARGYLANGCLTQVQQLHACQWGHLKASPSMQEQMAQNGSHSTKQIQVQQPIIHGTKEGW